jgi:phage shock protein PspC (stress-responsive transcriptional regulator)
MMHNVQPSLFARDDTILGVCQGLGEDFGFNPLFLRAAIPLPLFFYPVETVGGYAVAGMVVLLSRLLVPNPSARAQREDCEAIVEQREASAQAGPDPMRLAA